MRVGVELMVTNISVAKSSVLPSKITHGTCMPFASAGILLAVEVQRRQAVLAVDDQIRLARLLQVADVVEAADRLEAQRAAEVNSSTAPGIGGWLHRLGVEVLDRLHLLARQLALEGGVGALDAWR